MTIAVYATKQTDETINTNFDVTKTIMIDLPPTLPNASKNQLNVSNVVDNTN